MSRKLRILLVEDTQVWIELILEALPAELDGVEGIDGFQVDLAVTGDEAQSYLTEAERLRHPYDVVILDIQLPQTDTGEPKPAVGIRILKGLNDRKCVAVVVESVEQDVEQLATILRYGPNDFLPKPFAPEEIRGAVVDAYRRSLDRIWYVLSQTHNYQWRVFQAQAQVADSMAETVTDGAGRVLDQIDVLSRLLEQRYQLNLRRDQSDPVCQTLQNLREATIAISRNCAESRAQSPAATADFETVDVLAAIRKAADKLDVGLRRRGLQLVLPQEKECVIETYRNDLILTIAELLYGAIETAPLDSAIEVAIDRDEQNGLVEIRITDQGEKLDAGHVERIAAGELFAPDAGRIWGLSLAQRVTQYVLGGIVQVEPNDSGNTIKLQLPL